MAYLDVEVFLECLELWVQLLLRICHITFLPLDSFLESLENICLHVILVEFGFSFLILVKLGAHVFGHLLLFSLHSIDYIIIASFLFHVDLLDFRHSLTESS